MGYQNISDRTRTATGASNTGNAKRWQNLYALNQGAAKEEMQNDANAAIAAAQKRADSAKNIAENSQISVGTQLTGGDYGNDMTNSDTDPSGTMAAASAGVRDQVAQQGAAVESDSTSVDRLRDSNSFANAAADKNKNLSAQNAAAASWFAGAGSSNPIVRAMDSSFSNIREQIDSTGAVIDRRTQEAYDAKLAEERAAAAKRLETSLAASGYGATVAEAAAPFGKKIEGALNKLWDDLPGNFRLDIMDYVGDDNKNYTKGPSRQKDKLHVDLSAVYSAKTAEQMNQALVGLASRLKTIIGELNGLAMGHSGTEFKYKYNQYDRDMYANSARAYATVLRDVVKYLGGAGSDGYNMASNNATQQASGDNPSEVLKWF